MPAALLYGARLLPLMLPKKALVVGEYYIGMCRNASIARWNGTKFYHWRRKFTSEFIESIHHPEDDEVLDCFVPILHANPYEVRIIDFMRIKIDDKKEVPPESE